MGRPRSFDTEAVLGAAMQLFWRRGYQAASLDELARLTGVNKPSLYAAFGDKGQLFLQVLERYHTALLAMSQQMLSRDGSAREAIRAWLLGYLPHCSGETGERGCLSINTSFEAAVLSPEVRASVDRFMQATEALLVAACNRGKAQGEFPPDFDGEGVGRVILVAQSGLLALARGRPPEAQTQAAMLRLLDSMLPGPGLS